VYASLGARRLIYGALFGCRASVTRSGRDTGVRKPEVGQLIAKRNWALGNANGFCYRRTGEAGLLTRRNWKLAAEVCYHSVDRLWCSHPSKNVGNDPLKTDMDFCPIQRFGPYRSVNTLRLCYKNPTGNVRMT